jgi:hypothetical protein
MNNDGALAEVETPVEEETPVEVEKTAAERLRKSESARAKRKVVKYTVTTRTENKYAKARRARKNKIAIR